MQILVLVVLGATLAHAQMWGNPPIYDCRCANTSEICNPTTGACASGCVSYMKNPGCSVGNLARNNPATQSTTYSAYGSKWKAAMAVDGNKNTSIWSDGCTHTEFQKDPWILLNLTRESTVFNVSILNRGDYGFRLSDIYVRVGNYPLPADFQKNAFCAKRIAPIADSGWGNFECVNGPLRGQYLVIQLIGEKKILTLCEIEMSGYRQQTSCPAGKHGPNCVWDCNCWSTTEDGTCNAIGGRCPSGCAAGFSGPLCQETCPTGYYGVNCASKCRCVGAPCNPVTGNAACIAPLVCEAGWSGTFCENGNIAENQLAIEKQDCDQSVTLEPYYCTLAIDGNTNMNFGGGSCTHTQLQPNAWWMRNFRVPSSVASVTIYNRANAYNRLANFDIRVGNSPTRDTNALCARYTGILPQNTSTTIPCTTTLTGQYLSIQFRAKSDYLTICEITVSGTTMSAVCADGKWGAQCASNCGNCKNGTVCDKVSGKCPLGCKAGFTGERCDTAVTCPEGWMLLTGYTSACYLHLSTPLRTQANCLTACTASGGTLVAIESPEENSAIYNWLKSNPAATDLITSGSCDAVVGSGRTCSWLSKPNLPVWTVGETQSFWSLGEPNNSGPVVQLWKAALYAWDDVLVDYMGQCLCEQF